MNSQFLRINLIILHKVSTVLNRYTTARQRHLETLPLQFTGTAAGTVAGTLYSSSPWLAIARGTGITCPPLPSLAQPELRGGRGSLCTVQCTTVHCTVQYSAVQCIVQCTTVQASNHCTPLYTSACAVLGKYHNMLQCTHCTALFTYKYRKSTHHFYVLHAVNTTVVECKLYAVYTTDVHYILCIPQMQTTFCVHLTSTTTQIFI